MRKLGVSGLAVQPIGLGGMPLSIQGRPDERTARAVIEAFVAGGGNHIDTAISYCLDNGDLGHNERLIAGSLAALKRTDVVVATKGGLTRPNGRWDVDCTPHWLRHCCEQSARDLGAPIPLYYLHTVDANVPFADSLGELVRLRDEGKIAAIGLSNVKASHLEEALRMAPIAAVQNRCNVLERRDVDSGLVERCRQLDVAYVPYSPVGGHWGHRRLAEHPVLARLAAKHGTSPQAIALAWLLTLGPHVVPIPGATKVSSVVSSLAAAKLELDADDRAVLDNLQSRQA
jgi:aryl-alcohol dehydrogenase-like predicted oxidoreductase